MTTQIIQTLAIHHINPILKSHGFEKKGLTWNCTRNNYVDVISLQKAKYSDAKGEQITGNLGIFIPEFYEAVFGRRLIFATEAECTIRIRFGELSPNDDSRRALDRWWTLRLDNIDLIGVEFVELIKSKAFSFLESLHDDQAIESYLDHLQGWQKKMPFTQLCLAFIQWKNGNEIRSAETLNNVDPSWLERTTNVRQWILTHSS